MKQTKLTAVKPVKKPSLHAIKRKVRASRPLHKRIALHPFTIMVLLCIGVLIAGVTIRSFADSYTVTATVPAPIPKTAAIIVSPLTKLHVSMNTVTVNGTCPTQSYVEISLNNALGGVSQCTNQSFQVQTSLNAGANQLSAQVYSLTDQAGPPSTPVTVYYDQTITAPTSTTAALTPVASTPTPVTAIGVSKVDNDDGLKSGNTLSTSIDPTVTGWAPAWSIVTVLFHSDPETCITQANAAGRWSCTLDQALPAGLHHVYVSAANSSGNTWTLPMFQINVTPTIPNLLVKINDPPLAIQATYHYQVYVGAQTVSLALGLTGGTAPYQIDTDWGDSTATTLTRSDTSSFTINHSYSASTVSRDYTILIHATDKQGVSSYVQLSAVVRSAGIALVSSSSSLTQYLSSMQHWLWLIWPTYAVVVLMAIGYYLGEREEYQHLMAKKRLRTAGKTK